MNVMSRVRLQTPHYYCDLPCSGDPTEYCGGGDAQINGGVWHRETVGRVGGEAGAGRGRAGRGGAGQGRAGQGRVGFVGWVTGRWMESAVCGGVGFGVRGVQSVKVWQNGPNVPGCLLCVAVCSARSGNRSFLTRRHVPQASGWSGARTSRATGT